MAAPEKLVSLIARNCFGLFGALASPRLAILIFHRVHARPDGLYPGEPDAVRFDCLMRFVARSFRVMTLGDAVTCLANGSLPSRALVITFDDGYADNAEVALPILQRYKLPATFFVSTGFLDGGRMWNDSVIECLRACTQPTIDLDFAGLGLGRRSPGDAAQRREVIALLLSRIKYLGLAEREEAISRLQSACGIKDLPTKLMMSSAQVLGLHRAGMEIGAHTVNHPILTALTPAEAENEIREGRNQLQDIIGAPVDLFAYPNGKPDRDYDLRHVRMLKEFGFRGAVTTAPGVAQPGDDLFELPRFTPWGESLVTWFARLLMNQRVTDFSTAGFSS